jgi:hypothetical protein
MKVNEVITEAGVWQGIKNVGRGLGQIAGGAATGVVQGLDMLAGGSGDVGTLKQRVQRKLNQTIRDLAAVNRELPEQALAHFEARLGQDGIDLNDPTTFNPTLIRNFLPDFGFQFFAGGEDDATKVYISKTMEYEPLPSKIDSKTVLNYFKELTKIRSNAIMWVTEIQATKALQQALQAQQAQQAQQTREPETSGLADGVSVFGTGEPMVLKVGKQIYYVADDGLWHERGNRNPVDSTWNAFLTQQADIATAESNFRDISSSTPAARK